MIDVEFFATGGTGPYTAIYSVDGGPDQSITLSPNTGSIPHNTAIVGSTTYTLLGITDSNGCMQSLDQSETITIHPIPTIAASGTDPSTCNGQNGSIELTFTGVPDGIYEIAYAGGQFTGVNVTAGVATIPNLSAGTFNDLSIIANTCESIDLPDVTLADPVVALNADITLPQDSCIDAVVDVIFSVSGGTGPYTLTYTIDAGAEIDIAVSNGTASIMHNTAATGTTTYTIVSVTDDANNCSQEFSISETITIHPLPTIAASGTDPSTCNGQDGSIELTFTGVPDGIYEIAYAGGQFTGVNVSAGTATISNLAAGVFDDLSIIANTCESIDLSDVTLADPVVALNADISLPQDSCIDAVVDVIFSVTGGTGPYTLTYTIDGGAEIDIAVSNGTAASILHNTAATGTTTYEIVSVTDDANNCSQEFSISETITIHPIPTIAASGTDPSTCNLSLIHISEPTRPY